MAVICWCAPLMGAQEALSCGQWNTEEFFETATAKDVTACLADRADVGARDESGITPLHWAAVGNQNPAEIQPLLAAGADPMMRTAMGRITLGYCARQREAEGDRRLLTLACFAIQRAGTGKVALRWPLTPRSGPDPAPGESGSPGVFILAVPPGPLLVGGFRRIRACRLLSVCHLAGERE